MVTLLKSHYILNLQESSSTVNAIMLSYSKKKQDRLQLIKIQKFQSKRNNLVFCLRCWQRPGKSQLLKGFKISLPKVVRFLQGLEGGIEIEQGLQLYERETPT